MSATGKPAEVAGTITLGGDLPVVRLGFGAMRITGPGAWGEPADPDDAVRVLRRVVELGVNFIDTADSYGPFVSELLIRRALHPYPKGLVVATKSGQSRPGPREWIALGRPEYLRQQCELSLRHLGIERIELYQLHRIDPQVPLEDQVGEFRRLQEEGKIRHIGLSEISVDDLAAARKVAPIASVQNMYNLGERKAEALLGVCERDGIAFIPWWPLAKGTLARPGSPLSAIAAIHHATPSQMALAWLLHRSPVMLPIPGTSRVDHLEENVAAASISLSEDEFAAMSGPA
jgi:pyridoxine 4-dehydrogenase